MHLVTRRFIIREEDSKSGGASSAKNDPCLVSGEQGADNGQPHSGAAKFAARGKEGLKYPRFIAFRDAAPIIADVKRWSGVGHSRLEHHLCGPMFGGVTEHVA